MRRSNAASSSSLKALSSDSMGTPCTHLGEAGARSARDALGGRVGRDQLGVLRLERAQLAHQPVVLGVGTDGSSRT